jgi:hypothetical protein
MQLLDEGWSKESGGCSIAVGDGDFMQYLNMY